MTTETGDSSAIQLTQSLLCSAGPCNTFAVQRTRSAAQASNGEQTPCSRRIYAPHHSLSGKGAGKLRRRGLCPYGGRSLKAAGGRPPDCARVVRRVFQRVAHV